MAVAFAHRSLNMTCIDDRPQQNVRGFGPDIPDSLPGRAGGRRFAPRSPPLVPPQRSGWLRSRGLSLPRIVGRDKEQQERFRPTLELCRVPRASVGGSGPAGRVQQGHRHDAVTLAAVSAAIAEVDASTARKRLLRPCAPQLTAPRPTAFPCRRYVIGSLRPGRQLNPSRWGNYRQAAATPEILRLQAGAAHQGSVDLRHRHRFRGVSRLYRAAIENSHLAPSASLADKSLRYVDARFRHPRPSVSSGTDRPYRLVGDYKVI